MSEVIVDTLKHSGNSGTANITLASDGKVSIPENKFSCPGAVIQVVSVNSGTTTTCPSTTAVDIDGLSASITCSHANNKVLAMMTVGGIWTANSNDDAATVILTKATTELCEHRNIGIGQSASLNQSCMLMNVTAAGDTNAHTYKGQFKNRQTSNIKVNQVTPVDSTLVLMEIVG